MALSLGRKAMVAALATTTLMVAGCATETRYRPATGQGFNRQGYSERMIEPGRFLVSFAGNSVTSRDTVERYLFYRAAELTLQQGFDYFVMADRDTNLQSRTFSTPGIGGPWGYGGFGGYWGPSWRYWGRGFGWRSWDPWFGGGFGGGFGGPWGNDFDVRTIDRYEATAEIVMRKGPIPRDNIRAFDARKVVESIGPTVQLPEHRTR
ncbi:hypothetical protein QE361_003300 [Sphingomonas sp. SORGH_AS802]|uniref:CC0125/CC1285 family lipoprotein n=1 Tax=unclassified Sphingomonas TaxID=196159 RepID=UPI0028573384|nr:MULTISPECIES: hypothetical protein [unclassified Sphingomonas]MDR6126465.1 hypothetical protein [Sphingomonas sp. SORGH_AS_0438]MDR6136295.1 hypothetical protein [Sphingomonas sp. SORGH_AS_0802]